MLMPRVLAKATRPFFPGTRNLNTISNFTTTKLASAGGPFSQLPEFTPLQDSILVSLPSSCILHTRTDQVCALSFDAKSKLQQQPLYLNASEKSPHFCQLSTGDEPVNAMLVSSTPMSNVLILNLDDYRDGWHLTDPQASVLCYSGNLEFQTDNQLIGRGTVAISGEGPVYQMQLGENESAIVNPGAILGYSNKVSVSNAGFSSQALVPIPIRACFSRYAGRYLEKLDLLRHKLLNQGKVYTEVKGPGTVLLQTSFVPGPKSYNYSDQELLQAFK
ncbi:LAME_0H10374g1_1 [Lachancea meyersii CBS 8951]|uniref:Altered inheritance of mitochondria protein 24, mitochondrial n=1 Tax=Lachancea meyersii CBS 8951 TaxID=1266667 RepID=A0A1G4KGD7_9SACH|nr:LAME_0H10374g1_1 [Lachancea meyersii CBS 8951]